MAFQLGAVYVVWSPANTRCAIGATQDLGKALAAQRRSIGRDAQLARVWWLSSLEAALDLAAAVGTALASTTTVEEIESRIREAARRLGIPLAEHDVTLARVRSALARLDHGLELAKSRGVLSFFNSRYRFLREKAVAAGQPFQSYGMAYNRLKAEIAKRLAERDGRLPDLSGIVDVILPLK